MPTPKAALPLEYIAPGLLVQSTRNPRKHPKEQIQALCENIRRFGFLVPVIVGADNVLITGHARTEAALRLDLDEIPIVRLANLTKEEEDVLRLSDNKISDLAEWDDLMFDSELERLKSIDVELLEGLGLEPIDADSDDDGDAEVGDDDFDIPDKRRVLKTCPNCGHQFD